jgi:hypothetical protein
MAPRRYPSSSYSLELDIQPDSGDSASPQETDVSHPEEIQHARQNDRARTPSVVPGASPGAREQQDTAFDTGSLYVATREYKRLCPKTWPFRAQII